MKSLFGAGEGRFSGQITRSFEWTQQTEEFDSALLTYRESFPVPACRGGQSIRFEIFADDPERASYECGELLAVNKVVFAVRRNATLKNGMIEIEATSVGMIDSKIEAESKAMNDCEPLNAWFSKKAAELFGSVFYQTLDGREVEVTQVSSNMDDMEYRWDDKVYLGKVVHYSCGGFVRQGRAASRPFVCNTRSLYGRASA